MRRRWLLAGSGWTLLAASLAILFVLVDGGALPRQRIFDPEAIYPAALYLDLAGWAEWNTPFAPYFVPDLPLFFLCLWATGDPVAATYLFGALQFVLLIAGFRWLCAELLRADDEARRLAQRWAVLVGVGLAVAFGYGLHGRGMLLVLFAAAFHTGAFVLAVHGQALLMASWRGARPPTPRRRLLLAGLFALCLAGVLSDRLFLTLFTLPAILTLGVAERLGGTPNRGTWTARLRTALVVAAGSLAGVLAVGWINAAGRLRIPAAAPIDPGRTLASYRTVMASRDDPFGFVLDRFFEHLGAGFRLYFFLWLLLTAALVFAGRRWLGRRPSRHGFEELGSESRHRLGVFALFTLASFAITAAAASWVAVGRYGVQIQNPGILFANRYLTALYVLPLLTAALYLPVLLGRRRTARLEPPLILGLALLCVVQLVRGLPPGPFPSYRPPQVACLDEQAAEHGWRYGLAVHGVARPVNVFSRRGLKVDQVDVWLRPDDWIASRRRAGAERGYDFVVTHQLRSEGALRDLLGSPDRELDCAGLRVWAWDAPRPLPAVP